MSSLRRFWFQFDRSIDLPPGVRIGCGVTATSEEDALTLLRERVFCSQEIPLPKALIADVDLSSLDDGHVRQNMGNPVLRGIWFPTGY